VGLIALSSGPGELPNSKIILKTNYLITISFSLKIYLPDRALL